MGSDSEIQTAKFLQHPDYLMPSSQYTGQRVNWPQLYSVFYNLKFYNNK